MYLNIHSKYSFKYGVLDPKDLLHMAGKYGLERLPLTDINSTAGSLSFVRLAKEAGIKPLLGIDFRNGAAQCFVGIAKNNHGFQELNQFLSYHLHSRQPIPPVAPHFKDVVVIYPMKQHPDKLRSYEYIGVRPDEQSGLVLSKWRKMQSKLVAMPAVTLLRPKRDFNTHRLLRAIDNNVLLSKLSKSEEASRNDLFWSPRQLKEMYADHPYLLDRSSALLEQCDIDFEFEHVEPQNLSCYTDSRDIDFQILKKLALWGINYRYPEKSFKIYRRLVKELQIIRQKDFVSYFLINCKIVSYARKKGYYYVGRGSGANSVVAYLLRITDVDPIELDLYFERFINLYRQNPPDFDIDFSSWDRDDITRFIFDYFNKKSPGGVALLATYSTFKYRAAVRELGKVFGLPPHEIDKLSSQGYSSDKIGNLVLKYSSYIENLPSHLSIHAGGILISEKPIHYFSSTILPPKGFPTVHFDMHIAEDVGLYKFDILGQRGLGKIKDCLELVRRKYPKRKIDIHDFKSLKRDKKIKSMMRDAKAIGCFYMESPAMRMLLTKLRAEEYLGLVAASSIIRPGVAKSGMMGQYILRFRIPERREEAHPVLYDIMPDTYGIMVYQEDVIKVAHYFAGLTLGEADVLRRGMSGKFRSREEFQKVKEKYFENCKAKGYDDALAADVWRQIESFAGYAFAKGHSASYAVESYQSMFLKAYYPLEYMVATINNGGGFYRREVYVHEARLHGAEIYPPCVNMSTEATEIYEKDIYLGFGMVKDLEENAILKIIDNRRAFGPFRHLEDFVKRVPISLEQLSILIRVGAFRFTGINKKKLMWKAYSFTTHAKKFRVKQPTLFQSDYKICDTPQVSVNLLEDAFDEMELLGFSLTSPFALLSEPLKSTLIVKDFAKHINEEVSIVGYLVAIKNTNTSKGERMNFGTFLDLNGDFLDTVHFPESASRWPFRGAGIYTLTGKVVEEFDFLSLEVATMVKERYIDNPKFDVNAESVIF